MGAIETTIDKIKQMLIDGHLGPGDRLPVEKDLAASLGVSRNTLREAVRALSSLKVLQTRQGDGTYVTSLRPGLLLDGMAFVADLYREDGGLQFLHVRRLLEPEATALAVGRLAEADLTRLSVEDAVREMATPTPGRTAKAGPARGVERAAGMPR